MAVRLAVTSVAGGADDVFATTLARMASKTAARSGSRTSRSKATSRDRSPTGSRPSVRGPAAPRKRAERRPAKRRNRSLLVCAGLTCGRAARATWLMAATGHRRRGAVDRPGPRHRTRTSPRRNRAGAAGPGRRRRRELVVRRRPADRRLGGRRCCGHSSARPSWLLPVVAAARGDSADAHGAQPRRAAAADPRLQPDRAVVPRSAPPVGGFAGGPRTAPACGRIHRLRHRWAAVGRADRMDRRAAVVHRRPVRPAAADRHHDPRGARGGAWPCSAPGCSSDEYDDDVRRVRRGLRGDDADTVEVDPGRDFSDGYYDQSLDDQPRPGRQLRLRLPRQDPDEVPTVPEPAVARSPSARRQETGHPSAGPRRRRSLHAAAAGSAGGRRSAQEAQRRQQPHGRRHRRRADPVQGRRGRHRLHPRTDRHPLRGRTGARASRWRRSPRCRRTSPTRWPPRACGCWPRSRASPPSASRCPTPIAKWCDWPTCSPRRRPVATTTRW